MLEIKNLVKTYGSNKVLDSISLTIEKGDIFGILGLSGAGKSTLVRCLNGLEKFDSGSILYDGEPVIFNRAYRRKVAMIFQNFNLLQQRTVLKNVLIAGELVGDKNRLNRATELLSLVGLGDKLKAYPSQLSGGERQRVAIARALMSYPEVLLCDEATSALDPDTTQSILQLLKELNQKMGLTIILIAHQLSVIESICNKVAILDHSRIAEMGLVNDVFFAPQTEIGRKLIYAGHLNTNFDEACFIRLRFNGNVETPLIANIIQDCNILVSIVFADSKTVNERVYGQMIIKLPAEVSQVEKLKKYLVLKEIDYEEVGKNELC